MIIEFGHKFVKNGPIMDNKVLFYSGRSLQHILNENTQKLLHFEFFSIFIYKSLNWQAQLCAISNSQKIYTKIEGMNCFTHFRETMRMSRLSCHPKTQYTEVLGLFGLRCPYSPRHGQPFWDTSGST